MNSQPATPPRDNSGPPSGPTAGGWRDPTADQLRECNHFFDWTAVVKSTAGRGWKTNSGPSSVSDCGPPSGPTAGGRRDPTADQLRECNHFSTGPRLENQQRADSGIPLRSIVGFQLWSGVGFRHLIPKEGIIIIIVIIIIISIFIYGNTSN